MKRRTFLKSTSLGVSAVLAGGGALAGRGPGKDRKTRIYGVPESVLVRDPLTHDQLRLSLSRTDIPVEAWRDLVAISCLAEDVFDNPEVAAEFSRNPDGYLTAIGMGDVRLNPEAVEVKVALSLGDADIRSAVKAHDVRTFLSLLESRGLLRAPEASQLADKLATHLQSVRLEDGEPESCTITAICLAAVWVWVAVVQDVVAAVTAAVGVSVYAYVLIITEVEGPKQQVPESVRALAGLPPFQLARALGGATFGERALHEFVEQSISSIAAAVENLEAYREHQPMDGEQLRELLRTQMMQQLTGRTQ